MVFTVHSKDYRFLFRERWIFNDYYCCVLYCVTYRLDTKQVGLEFLRLPNRRFLKSASQADAFSVHPPTARNTRSRRDKDKITSICIEVEFSLKKPVCMTFRPDAWCSYGQIGVQFLFPTLSVTGGYR